MEASARRMNLAVLQRRDPYICEIIQTASHASLYTFNASASAWVKDMIEGSFFVYERSAPPKYGFMILNSRGLQNFIEPLEHGTELQMQDQFLLYRSSKGIHGLWFFEADQVKAVCETLQRLVGEPATASASHSTGMSNSSGQGVAKPSSQEEPVRPPPTDDITTILVRAQEKYSNKQPKQPALPRASSGAGGADDNACADLGLPMQMTDCPPGNSLQKPLAVKPTTPQSPDDKQASGPSFISNVNASRIGHANTSAARGVRSCLFPPTGPISLETLFNSHAESNGHVLATSQGSDHVSLLKSQPTSILTVTDIEERYLSEAAAASAAAVPSKANQSGVFSVPNAVEPPANGCAAGSSKPTRTFSDSCDPAIVSSCSADPKTAVRSAVDALSPATPVTKSRILRDNAQLLLTPDTLEARPPDPLLPLLPRVDSSLLLSDVVFKASTAPVAQAPQVSTPTRNSQSAVSGLMSPMVFSNGVRGSAGSPATDLGPDFGWNVGPRRDSLHLSTGLSSRSTELERGASSSSLLYGNDRRLGAALLPASNVVIQPLTKEQLRRALLELIQNDDTFIDSLHAAYIRSLDAAQGRSCK